MRCPHCGKEWHERDEKEFNRIKRKKKREEKEMRALYMKDLREDKTTLDFDEWMEYQNKEDEDERHI